MLIILHNLLPHEHNIVQDKYKVAISDPVEYDFFSFIKNIFLQDLGEDHLENFHISDGDHMLNHDLDFVISPLIIPPALCSLQSKDFSPSLIVYPDFENPPDIRAAISSVGLRAPPHIS